MIIRTKTTIDHHIPSGKITSPIYAKLIDWSFGRNGIKYIGEYYVVKETIQQEQKDAVLDQEGFEIEPAQPKVSRLEPLVISSFNEQKSNDQINALFKANGKDIKATENISDSIDNIVKEAFLYTYQNGDYFNQPANNFEVV